MLHRGGFGNVSKRSYRGKEVAVKMLEVNGELKTILSVRCQLRPVSYMIVDKSIMNRTAVLQGVCVMEGSSASKCAATHRRDSC